jgi:hypothetical protein
MLTNGNCSICRRYGVLWAYYKAADVRVIAKPSATQSYSWGRLGFAPALPESAGVDLEPDELLMLRDLNAPE